MPGEFYARKIFPAIAKEAAAKSGKTSTIKEEDYYAKN